ncbi:alanine racemase [Patescibacteria group bacterium]|nr:alanine racemase [Patescibacteria group bacterium]
MKYTNSWLEIESSAIRHNLQIFRKIIGSKVCLMAVVKSNAYGHGFFEVAKICDKTKEVDWLGVANLEEALELRNKNIKKPILVLSYYDLNRKQFKEAIKKGISLTVYDLRQLKFINKIAEGLNKRAKIHFKVDTGTSRIGLPVNKVLSFIRDAQSYKKINIKGLFTHYATAEEVNQKFTIKQTQIFYQLIQKLEKHHIFIPLKHTACSAATLLDKMYHFDLIRLGISLYGLWSLENGKAIKKGYNLKPALTWKTKIIQVKNISPGQTIGYGRTFKSAKKMKLVILPIGYWEGYDRHLSNKGEVLIHGQRCKVRGRVCMNLTMVEVDNIKNVKVGDEVVLLGKQGSEVISAEELANKVGTINYEIVTRINPLIPRIIK